MATEACLRVLWKQYQQLVFFNGLAALYLLLSFSYLTTVPTA